MATAYKLGSLSTAYTADRVELPLNSVALDPWIGYAGRTGVSQNENLSCVVAGSAGDTHG